MVRLSDPFREGHLAGWDPSRCSPNVLAQRLAPSPSQSSNWSDSSEASLSHASSQRSLDKTVIPVNSDDPFGVPLRSRKSGSSADGSRRSSRSSGKLSIKSNPKTSVAVDPFGVPLCVLRNSSSTDVVSDKLTVAIEDSSPFSNAFEDNPVQNSPGKWEAFVEHQSNGVDESKSALVSDFHWVSIEYFGIEYFGIHSSMLEVVL